MLLVQLLLRYQFICKAYLGIDRVNVLVKVNVNVPENMNSRALNLAYKQR